MHNVEVIDLKTFSFKHISLYVQIFLIIVLVGVGIAYFFVEDKDLMNLILYGVLALLMLIMAYNNKNFYKRKYMTYIYLALRPKSLSAFPNFK
jgi:predicted Na+-dependent transporter